MRGQIFMILLTISIVGIVAGFTGEINWLAYLCSFVAGFSAHQIGLILDDK